LQSLCLSTLALQGQGPTYIILDALDECPVTSSILSPREEVLELVEDLIGLHLPNLRICVTSRPEPDIQIVLERLTEQPVSFHDESGQTEDIANHVSSSVHTDRRTSGFMRMLNLFCQLELLRQCFPPSVAF